MPVPSKRPFGSRSPPRWVARNFSATNDSNARPSNCIGRSAAALARGFFGTQTDVAFEAASAQEDTLLMFYDLCDDYVNTVLKNSDTYAQRDAFLKSQEVLNADRKSVV